MEGNVLKRFSLTKDYDQKFNLEYVEVQLSDRSSQINVRLNSEKGSVTLSARDFTSMVKLSLSLGVFTREQLMEICKEANCILMSDGIDRDNI